MLATSTMLFARHATPALLPKRTDTDRLLHVIRSA
jgi:hypothetical protein